MLVQRWEMLPDVNELEGVALLEIGAPWRQEISMDTKADKVGPVLDAMGFAPERVQAALAALDDEAPQGDDGDEGLLTPRGLCGRLKVSPTTLWRMRQLPFVRVGGRKRFDWNEVRKHLGGGKR